MVLGFIMDVCANQFAFANFWQNWQALSFLALATMTTVLGLAYILSELFRVHSVNLAQASASYASIPQMQVWIRFELFQIFATALLVLFVSSLVFSLCNIKADIVTGDPALKDKTTFAAATDYLHWLRNTAAKSWGILAAINGAIQRIANVTWINRPGGFGFATTPAQGFAVYSSGASIMFSTLMIIILTTLAQINVLAYINIAMLTYVLPMGVLLRCIEPTRQFGGMLMGLAIGLFLFYPLLLLLNDAIVRPTTDSTISKFNTLLSNLNAGTIPEIAGRSLEENAGGIVPAGGGTGTTGAGAGGTPGGGAGGAGVGTEGTGTGGTGGAGTGSAGGETGADSLLAAARSTNSATNAAATVAWFMRLAFSLMLAGIVLPAINFIILITAVRELTKALGEEIDVSSLTRMI